MTSGVEVVPGVFVQHPKTIVMVSEFDGRTFRHEEPRPMVTLRYANGTTSAIDGTAAEVAAKLWPRKAHACPDLDKVEGIMLDQCDADTLRAIIDTAQDLLGDLENHP